MVDAIEGGNTAHFRAAGTPGEVSQKEKKSQPNVGVEQSAPQKAQKAKSNKAKIASLLAQAEKKETQAKGEEKAKADQLIAEAAKLRKQARDLKENKSVNKIV